MLSAGQVECGKLYLLVSGGSGFWPVFPGELKRPDSDVVSPRKAGPHANSKELPAEGEKAVGRTVWEALGRGF